MIFVFGSINIDLVARVERIAAPGETVLGPSYCVIAGGKGANQALAARRAGASVAMVGAVGIDGFAQPALAQLIEDGVDISRVSRVDAPTGAAFIAVDAQGQNAITVASGANGHARAAQLAEHTLQPSDWLLLQRETPDKEGEAAARIAKARGARVMLNLAPAGAIHDSYLALIDILVVNEHEADLLGQSRGLVEPTLAQVSEATAKAGCAAMIVTLGAAGAQGWSAGQHFNLPAFKVAVVDTTAAGDAFVGAFAAALAQGEEFRKAMRFGLAAGSLACTKTGAQPSLPHANDIASLLASQN